MDKLEASIFDLSPIPMWIQDYSGVKKIFDQWVNQGITDLKTYLYEDPKRLLPCLGTIQTMRINQSTLRLYEANSLEEILENFAKFHFEEITIEQIDFFLGLWNRRVDSTFSAINYTCNGRQIDVQLRANILEDKALSWDQVLLTTEDISQSQNARRFAESLFFHSPTALWVKDYSAIKLIFDDLQDQGVKDLDQYIKLHPDFIEYCFKQIKNTNVNQALLSLFKAKDKHYFFEHVLDIFQESNLPNFYIQLLSLWKGLYQQTQESEYKAFNGDLLDIREQLVIFPDSAHNWDTVQISLTDFTERKKLENYLLHISNHDHLTQLNNRSFFNDEVLRLQSHKVSPVSCIFLDINGLKEINDTYGHDQGDEIIKRFAQILKSLIKDPTYSVSRIGGDEFVVLMPRAKQSQINQLLNSILKALEIDKSKHPTRAIQVAIGYASSEQNESIDELLKRADAIMYKNKQAFYALHHFE